MKVGVSTEKTPTAGTPVNITGTNGTNDYSAYFISDNAAYEIVENGTKTALVVASGVPVAKITKGEKTKKFDTLQKAINYADNGDTVVMVADSTEKVTVASDDNITLDLNGCVLNLNGGHIVNKGILEIKDSKPTATHTGEFKDYTGGVITNGQAGDTDDVLKDIGGAIVVIKDGNDAAITMSSGTIVNCSATNGGAIFVGEGASFTMNGGTIKNNTAVKNGGGIQNSQNASFTFKGGSITGNNAKTNYSGGIFTKGTMNLRGKGSIANNTTGDSSKVSDNVAVVKDYSITIDNYTGKAIGVSVLEKNNVYERTSGAFTINGEAKDVQYFFSESDKYYVKHVVGASPNAASLNSTAGHLELAVITVIIDKNIEHGKVEVDNQGAGVGEKAKLTVIPDDGYKLDKITIRNKDGQDITSAVLNGTTITMPAEDNLPITVSASFKKKATGSTTTTTDTTKGSTTKTGDSNNLLTYFILLDLMLVGIAVVLYVRIRGQKK